MPAPPKNRARKDRGKSLVFFLSDPYFIQNEYIPRTKPAALRFPSRKEDPLRRPMPHTLLLAALTVTSASHTQTVFLQHGGMLRECLLHVPPSYTGRTPAPLVIVMHGFTQTPEAMESQSGFSVKADREGFITAYPAGVGFPPRWNLLETGTDDAGFVAALIDTLLGRYSLDPLRIYLAGFSNGGGLAYRMALRFPRKIAAIGCVASMWVEPEGALDRPVPIIHFHALDDAVVPYRRARSAVIAWSEFYGCGTHPDTVLDVDGATGLGWSRPGEGESVVLITTDEGSHSWPGGNPYLFNPTRAVSATDLMWEFFVRHPLDGSGPSRTAEVPAPGPSDFRLHPAYPNPFNGYTAARFELERGGPVSLMVLDGRGRVVRVLFRGPAEPGVHMLSWDGKGDAGAEAASGMYFFRLTAGHRSSAVKILLAR
jgi:polyhydroxybutyrate depolymerase